jgi:hypothetical protein
MISLGRYHEGDNVYAYMHGLMLEGIVIGGAGDGLRGRSTARTDDFEAL